MFALKDAHFNDSKVKMLLEVLNTEYQDDQDIISFSAQIHFNHDQETIYKQKVSLSSLDLEILNQQLNNLDLDSPCNLISLYETDLSFLILNNPHMDNIVDLIVCLDSGCVNSGVGTESGLSLKLKITISEFIQWQSEISSYLETQKPLSN